MVSRSKPPCMHNAGYSFYCRATKRSCSTYWTIHSPAKIEIEVGITVRFSSGIGVSNIIISVMPDALSAYQLIRSGSIVCIFW